MFVCNPECCQFQVSLCCRFCNVSPVSRDVYMVNTCYGVDLPAIKSEYGLSVLPRVPPATRDATLQAHAAMSDSHWSNEWAM